MKPVLLSDQFERIAELLLTRAGLAFPANRQGAAQAEILHEMERVGLSDATQYGEALDNGGPLLDDLLARLTIGETYFFREPGQLERVRREVLPALAAERDPSLPLRVWSAGCASGEEPYTLAILLEQAGLLERARVLGTDIARDRLLRARRGRYRSWAFRGVEQPIIDRYFEHRHDEWCLRSDLRRAVEFRYLNLAEDNYPSLATGTWGMDLILCRNVLIYFSGDTVRAVAARLLNALTPDGWLFLGASDPPLAELVACDVMPGEHGVAYRPRARTPRPGARRISLPTAVAPPASLDPAAPDPHAPEPPVANGHAPSLQIAPPAAPPAAGTPATPTSAALTAADLYAAREYDAAIIAAERDLTDDPESLEAGIVVVRALANLGRLDDAGRRCTSVVERHPFAAEPLYLQAVLLGAASEWQASAEAARRAIYLDDSLAVAHLALGTALARLGRADPARRAFAAASRLLSADAGDAVVRGSDGETAERLDAMARMQLRLLGTVA